MNAALTESARADLRRIRDFPRSGRAIPELQHDNLREVLEQGYRIFYEVIPDRIVSSRQDIRPQA